jgi:hypothetical protein
MTVPLKGPKLEILASGFFSNRPINSKFSWLCEVLSYSTVHFVWNMNKKRRRQGFFLSPSEVAITTMAAGVGCGGVVEQQAKKRPPLCHPNPSPRHLLTAPVCFGRQKS